MRTRTQLNRSMGYSLIELLVVLAIIGILVIAGVATVGSKNKAAVRELTQQMAASLAEAQQMARSTGRLVVLHVNGSTPTTLSMDFEYQVPDPAHTGSFLTIRGGGFAANAQGTSTAYAVVGINRTQATATKVDMAGLSGLGLVSNWSTFFVDDNAVFKGAESQALTFTSDGQISQDAFITVSSPVAGSTSPLGVVVATRRNGIHAYFFSNEPGTTWRSL